MNERLYRSKIHRVFGGVAGGLAEYLNLDPIIVRILFIIITVINGFGIFLYIILWIIIPESDVPYSSLNNPPGASENSGDDKNQNVKDDSSSSKNEFDPVQYYNQKAKKKANRGRVVVGLILISFGFIFLAEQYFSYFDFEDFLPLALIAVGIILIWNSSKKNK
ncbi:MAG: PspC domain-containing protein [Ignavibacteriae bacterium]|nr:PspC domain-containing protein [Ignavibacteriota bacterium]NOG97466.1 PspC domain-containing protein [Ignavibacteriota bacterium]